MRGDTTTGDGRVVNDKRDLESTATVKGPTGMRRQCNGSTSAHGRGLVRSALLSLAVLCQIPSARAGNDGDDYIYSASAKRSWMYESSSIGMEVVGCVWGYTEGGEDSEEDMACRESESEDGTTYWYQMANCRRAQVAYNVFASDSNSISCSSSTFKESLVTKTGLAEFIYTMNSYDENTPLSNVDYGDLPMCEEDGNGYYLSVGCTSSGTFAINKFSDEYCMAYSDVYNTLDDLNSAMQNLQSCHTAYDSSSGNSAYQSLSAYLIPYSGSCTSVDSALCQDTEYFGNTASGRSRRKNSHSGSGASAWVNKIKYVLGSLLLVASVTMFMGILFTNRRRRRAMMHRRFRQSASRSKSRGSRGRGGSRSKSRTRTRSSSRARRSKEESGDGGVFT